MRFAFAGVVMTLAACATVSTAEKAQSTYDEGIKAMAEGKYVEAIQKFSDAIAAKPDYELAYYKRGCARLEMVTRELAKDPRETLIEAVRDFSESIKYWPLNYDGYYNRAICHATLAMYREAVKDLQAVLRASDAELLKKAHRKLGLIYEEEYEEMKKEALLHYEAYLELGGDDPAIRQRVAALRTRIESKGKDAEDIEAEKLYAQAMDEINRGRTEPGLSLLQELVRKYPQSRAAREKALPVLIQHIKTKAPSDPKPER